MDTSYGINEFQDVDIFTGRVNFEWNTLGHIPVTESFVAARQMPGSYSTSWEFI